MSNVNVVMIACPRYESYVTANKSAPLTYKYYVMFCPTLLCYTIDHKFKHNFMLYICIPLFFFFIKWVLIANIHESVFQWDTYFSDCILFLCLSSLLLMTSFINSLSNYWMPLTTRHAFLMASASQMYFYCFVICIL